MAWENFLSLHAPALRSQSCTLRARHHQRALLPRQIHSPSFPAILSSGERPTYYPRHAPALRSQSCTLRARHDQRALLPRQIHPPSFPAILSSVPAAQDPAGPLGNAMNIKSQLSPIRRAIMKYTAGRAWPRRVAASGELHLEACEPAIWCATAAAAIAVSILHFVPEEFKYGKLEADTRDGAVGPLPQLTGKCLAPSNHRRGDPLAFCGREAGLSALGDGPMLEAEGTQVDKALEHPAELLCVD
ncbi:hypothetical protein BDK51DRAFT_38286 [Blyttiomyces helicus]|uniref:Uncharacterized protein n=1 Tax=Blyttiomyces helicus TaxID=388810 RepID=A0A4P9W7E0_9FUNG|nr:hypothetical protein BDK51DRAFT_38286 [Blyttiomyces helicus]|eukprot:RKO86938.1 hypothetical protein BDK51DRAFT_38286 [Blyttiomyces helicus]